MLSSIRVPLLNPADALVRRLDITATWTQAPPGEPHGFDSIFREPVQYLDGTGARTDARQYSVAIRVPCQIKVMTWEELAQEAAGDDGLSKFRLTFHRRTLELLSLIDSTTRACLLKKGDMITALERHNVPGSMVLPFDAPVFIWEIRPASLGMGPDHYDLHHVFLTARE